MLDPCTKAVLTRVPKSNPDEVRQAVDSCVAAFSIWSITNKGERQDRLLLLSSLIRMHEAEIVSPLTWCTPRRNGVLHTMGMVIVLMSIALYRLALSSMRAEELSLMPCLRCVAALTWSSFLPRAWITWAKGGRPSQTSRFIQIDILS